MTWPVPCLVSCALSRLSLVFLPVLMFFVSLTVSSYDDVASKACWSLQQESQESWIQWNFAHRGGSPLDSAAIAIELSVRAVFPCWYAADFGFVQL